MRKSEDATGMTWFFVGTWLSILGLCLAFTGMVFGQWIPAAVFLSINGWFMHKKVVGGETLPRHWVLAAALLGGMAFLTSAYNLQTQLSLDKLPTHLIGILLAALALTSSLNHSYRAYWLQLLNLVLTVVGCLLKESSAFSFAMALLASFLVILNLNAAHLYFGLAAARSGGIKVRIIRASYFRSLLYTYLVGIIFAAGVFFLFPRAKNFTILRLQGEETNETGYSGGVHLSADGRINESNALALSIEVNDVGSLALRLPDMLWKGAVLESFTGERWARRQRGKLPTEEDDEDALLEREKRQFVIMREPARNLDLFYTGFLVSYRLNGRSNAPIDLDPQDALRLRGRFPQRMIYETNVRLLRQDFMDVLKNDAIASSSEPGMSELTEVPTAIAGSSEFKAWLDSLEVDEAAGPATVVGAMTKKFSTDFKADLKNSFSGKDPLLRFLSDQKSGHCEYFATAAALTLRSLGIPARVAVGYRGGTYNRISEVIEVRSRNAHAWVEFYVSGYGWLPFDPTPPTSEAMADGQGSRLLEAYSSLQYWFNRYVVQYDRDTQLEIIDQFKRGLDGPAKGKNEPDASRLWQGGAAIAAFAGLIIIYFALRGSGRRAERLPPYYRSMRRRLRRLGFQRSSHETLEKFHARAMPHLSSTMQAELAAVNLQVHRDLYDARSWP